MLAWVPASAVRERLAQAAELAPSTTTQTATTLLGNGSPPTAQTTVPFALWCAAQHQGDFEEAIWQALTGQGDCDTIAASVGGITIMRTGLAGVPPRWQELIKPLPAWVTEEPV